MKFNENNLKNIFTGCLFLLISIEIEVEKHFCLIVSFRASLFNSTKKKIYRFRNISPKSQHNIELMKPCCESNQNYSSWIFYYFISLFIYRLHFVVREKSQATIQHNCYWNQTNRF